MTTDDWQELFHLFLLEEGALEQYIKAIKSEGGSVTERLSGSEYNEWLTETFCWAESEEGHDFWYDLAMKWWELTNDGD